MLEMYQCYTPKPTDTYGTEDRCVSDLSLLAHTNAAYTVVMHKASDVQKAATGHFEHAVRIDVTSINMSCSFTIIKTLSISCN